MKLRILVPLAAVALLAFVGSAQATFHEWLPEEFFSNATGTVQYIEFSDAFNGENLLTNTSITSATTGNTFHFTTNLPSTSTAGHNLLIATPSYAALPGVPAPDYVLPINSFFSTSADSISFIGSVQPAFSFTAGQLPTDGHTALFGGGSTHTTGTPSPTDFAGATGTVSLPEPTTLASLVWVPASSSPGVPKKTASEADGFHGFPQTGN